MIDQKKPSTIDEPPSLAEIRDAGDRVGQVDFTQRLGDRQDETDENDEVDAEDGKSRVAALRTTDEGEGAGGGPSLMILPPARVDSELAANVARDRAEEAAEDADDVSETPAATAEVPVPDTLALDPGVDLDDDIDSDLVDIDPELEAEGSREPALAGTKRKKDKRRKNKRKKAREIFSGDDEPADEPVDMLGDDTPAETIDPTVTQAQVPAVAPAAPEPAPRKAPPEGLVMGVADLATVKPPQPEVTDELPEHGAIDDELGELDEDRPPLPSIGRGFGADFDLGSDDFDDLEDDGDLAEPLVPTASGLTGYSNAGAPVTDPELSSPTRSVAEVAQSVIASMRRVAESHERHLEAIETEAARRCELLTAQAELDAELIRLHGRREAHAIISAAKSRAGDTTEATPEAAQLNEIGETFSRFAETIESAIEPDPETRKP